MPGLEARADKSDNGTGRVTDLNVEVIKDVTDVTEEVPGAVLANKGEGGLTLPTLEP